MCWPKGFSLRLAVRLQRNEAAGMGVWVLGVLQIAGWGRTATQSLLAFALTQSSVFPEINHVDYLDISLVKK